MMKIEIKNKIDLDGQIELIHEEHDVVVTEKNDWLYLIYQNDDAEKVVIKCQNQEMIMTRFGQPNTIMRFVNGAYALASIPTPMGLQQLVTLTKSFDRSENSLRVTYDLLPNEEANQVFASYTLQISWS
ncbi:DUF1934 domain-containing protein [Streptococcus sp. sy010]|uniref:DUF1934 domain-containing protein n=1 Tax=Streptococcus sp. sy010 TaxID=2600148 RepID=UPI0037D99171